MTLLKVHIASEISHNSTQGKGSDTDFLVNIRNLIKFIFIYVLLMSMFHYSLCFFEEIVQQSKHAE